MAAVGDALSPSKFSANQIQSPGLKSIGTNLASHTPRHIRLKLDPNCFEIGSPGPKFFSKPKLIKP
jgi:hypothetical protein